MIDGLEINMKKQELLKYFDEELLDKLFGFCYARTNDSHEAEILCSDIIFALVKSANTEGEIESVYSFIWKVARNVYANYSEKRRQRKERLYEGDSEELFLSIADEEESDESKESLEAVYRRIAFLTKAYREVMIMFYLDGLSAAEIAKRQSASEGAVRQRLFSARERIKSEVEKMTETYNKPVALDKIDFVIWGTGDPGWGDPRNVCTRMLSNHIVWLCHKKPMTASEIAKELNVPTLYVEEELEILCRGENGSYGLLRRQDNGRFAINFILLDKDVIEKANAIYTEQLPGICKTISDFIEKYKDEYLAFPYLNKKVDLNLILWQQIKDISAAFSENVKTLLKKKHFADVEETARNFSVFGYVDNGTRYGGGCDGIHAFNVCGFSHIFARNIYVSRVNAHFHCGHDIATDGLLQLAVRAIDGLNIAELSEIEREHAAKAIECGYLYREDDMLYTKILVSSRDDDGRLFKINDRLNKGYFDKESELVAANIAELIKKSVPKHLLGEWRFANTLASLPILDSVIEALIENGILIPPENGIGAEGCWMSVEK